MNNREVARRLETVERIVFQTRQSNKEDMLLIEGLVKKIQADWEKRDKEILKELKFVKETGNIIEDALNKLGM